MSNLKLALSTLNKKVDKLMTEIENGGFSDKTSYTKAVEAAYSEVVKVKNEILRLNERYLPYYNAKAEINPIEKYLCECDGSLINGIICLTIKEALPHQKVDMFSYNRERWQGLIYTSFHQLARKEVIPFYEKAFIGIKVEMPNGVDNRHLWDTSNRAINLIINVLKGKMFQDDNINHLAFGIVGSTSDDEKTTIFIGDFCKDIGKIFTLLQG